MCDVSKMQASDWRILGPVAANFENDYKRKEKL